jgi:Tol biopolymer transport system component
MARRNTIAFPVALVCLLVGACGHFVAPAARPPAPPILVSVSSHAVYLVDPHTGQVREVARPVSDFQGGYASWAPDHSRFAYGNDGIMILEPRLNREEPLVPGRGLSMPAWSPDGRRLVYGDGVSLWVTDVEHIDPARIRIPAVLAPLEMTWSSTGVIAFEGLALDCSQIVRCVSTGSSEIWTILPDGTGLIQLTHVGHAEKPKWAPDGSTFLFVRRYPKTKKPDELWEARADGSGSHLVLRGPVLAADWAPDGSSLAVARPGSKPKTVQVWTGHPDGSSLRARGKPMKGEDATLDW